VKRSILKRFFKGEDGSVTILVALSMTVLMGFAALSVDIGMLYNQKREVQNAADAAALAGAMSLPNANLAKSIAKSAAAKNLLQDTSLDTISYSIVPVTPYDGNKTEIEVIVTRKVKTIFAQVLGIADSEVSARAVAKQRSTWAGQSLPFINVNNDYSEDDPITFTIWDKDSEGFYASIDQSDWDGLGDSPNRSFEVTYLDGVNINNGVEANPEAKKKILEEIWDNIQDTDDKTVYILSLKSSIINSPSKELTLHNIDPFAVEKTKTIKIEDINTYIQSTKWYIDENDLVLLEVTLDKYKFKEITLTYIDEHEINGSTLPDVHGVMIYASSLID